MSRRPNQIFRIEKGETGEIQEYQVSYGQNFDQSKRAKPNNIVFDDLVDDFVILPSTPVATNQFDQEKLNTSPVTTNNPSQQILSQDKYVAINVFKRELQQQKLFPGLIKFNEMFNNSIISCDHHTVPPISDGKVTLMKTASFDLDWTLIKPKFGKKFPKDANDWEWLYPTIPKQLRDLYYSGYDIVIFSNQSQCKHLGVKEQIIQKIRYIIADLQIPISVYISTKKDHFRKPARGMFDLMLDRYYDLYYKQSPELTKQLTQSLLHSDSFYCGDACGRRSANVSNNNNQLGNHSSHENIADFSSTDLAFAINCWGYQQQSPLLQQQQQQPSFPGQRFYTPEEFFLKKQSHSPPRLIQNCITDPYHNDVDLKKVTHVKIQDTPLFKSLQNTNQPQLIINIGIPGTGKTTFTKELIQLHEKHQTLPKIKYVNMDTLGRSDLCLQTALTALRSGFSAIIDNTNINEGAIDEYLKMAHRVGNIRIHAVYFDIHPSIALHLNMVRTCYTLGSRDPVPKGVIESFKAKMNQNQQIQTILTNPSSINFSTVTVRHYMPLFPQYTAQTPYPTPLWAPTQKKNDGKQIDSDREQGLEGYGTVTKSRSFQDYFYQIYEYSPTSSNK